MKSKIKFSILILALICVTTSLQSQSLYLNTGIGNGININGNIIGINSPTYHYTTDSNYTVSEYNNNKLSLGSGYMPNIGIGYHFNENWSIEINGLYLFGKPQNYSSSVNYEYKAYKTTYSQVSEFTGKTFMINPAVIYKSNREKDLEFYTKIGLLFGFTNIYRENIIEINDGIWSSITPFSSITENWEYTGNISYGAAFGLGLDYSFTEDMNLFAEINYIQYSAKPSNAILTKYIYEGEDKLSELTDKEKEIEFVDQYSDEDLSDNSPNKALYTKYSFNMIQLNFGIRWRLTNRSN